MSRRFPRRLDQSFFAPDTLDVARRILGCTLVHGECSGVIVEVEAYKGDPASHYVTRRHAGAIMGTTHGHVYIYSIYGMHLCLNFTTDQHGPGAVLVRALEPRGGVELMRERRGVQKLESLCSGPGKLVQAMGIDTSLHGLPVTRAFMLLDREREPEIVTGPRIGISVATELPWRFMVKGSPFLSRRAPR